MSRAASRREGVGTAIPLVVGLMGLLFLGGIFLLVQSGSSMSLGTTDAGGLVAESLATSAIEEALLRFQKQVNDPESEVFEIVRERLIKGEEPDLDLTEYCEPEKLRGILNDSPNQGFYRHLTIESLSVTMRTPMREAALEALPAKDAAKGVLPGEQFLDVDCSVSLRLRDVVIWRRVAVRRRYGMTFISPYKPFDQMTFAIVSSGFLETYPQLLQDQRRLLLQIQAAGSFVSSLEGQLERAAELVERGRRPPRIGARPVLIELGEPPSMPSDVRTEFNEILNGMPWDSPQREAMREMEPDERGWAEWALVAGRPSTQLDRPAPRSPTRVDMRFVRSNPNAISQDVPASDSVIFTTEPKVKLEEFDYEKQIAEEVEPRIEELSEKIEPYNRAAARLMSVSDYPLSGSRVRALEGAVERLRREIVRSIPPIVESLNRITLHVSKHTTVGMTSAVLEGYMGSTSRRLNNLAYHADSKKDIERLRETLPAFNGHLNYNGTEPIELDERRWRGKTVISGPWRPEPVPVTLSGFTIADSRRDLAIINFDELHLGSGTIEAAVFVNSRTVFEGRPAITGNLVLRRLAAREERTEDEDLRGTVEYDRRIASGGFWTRKTDESDRYARIPEDLSFGHYTVGLCPRTQERVIYRSPQKKDQDPWIGAKSQ